MTRVVTCSAYPMLLLYHTSTAAADLSKLWAVGEARCAELLAEFALT